MRKLLYIAGVISSGTKSDAEIDQNVSNYEDAAAEFVKHHPEYAPILPAVSNHHLGRKLNWTWRDYMLADLPLLRKADAILMTPGWEKSEGARIENLIAEDLGIEVIYQ